MCGQISVRYVVTLVFVVLSDRCPLCGEIGVRYVVRSVFFIWSEVSVMRSDRCPLNHVYKSSTDVYHRYDTRYVTLILVQRIVSFSV